MSAEQIALDGFTTEKGRIRPSTLIHCRDCDEWILRSRRDDHDGHTVVDPEVFHEEANDDEEEDEIVEKVGSWFDITLSYSVDYRFRIPAWNEHQAEEVAREMHWDRPPADEMHVHSDKREIEEIYEDDPDLPDDFDPYGSTRLVEVLLDDE